VPHSGTHCLPHHTYHGAGLPVHCFHTLVDRTTPTATGLLRKFPHMLHFGSTRPTTYLMAGRDHGWHSACAAVHGWTGLCTAVCPVPCLSRTCLHGCLHGTAAHTYLTLPLPRAFPHHHTSSLWRRWDAIEHVGSCAKQPTAGLALPTFCKERPTPLPWTFRFTLEDYLPPFTELVALQLHTTAYAQAA